MNVAIIQARMGSTRLPGKVLKEIDGVPLLKIMLQRVMAARKLNKVVTATSVLPIDNPIVDFCVSQGYECFRGPESDVLSRYYECATVLHANVIVRLTADCPLIDPKVIDSTVELYERAGVDYAANTVPPETSTFPDGSDVEVFSYEALARAHREATDPLDREHVTFYFWRDPARGFKTAQLRNSEDWSKFRFTVDYVEDFEVIKVVVSQLFQNAACPSLSEIVEFLKGRPALTALNNKYYFGQGWK